MAPLKPVLHKQLQPQIRGSICAMSVGDLREHEQANLLPQTEQTLNELRASIKEHGIRVPLDVKRDGVILAGTTRYRIAKQLGLKEVPVRFVDIPPEDEVAYIIADNVERRQLTPPVKEKLVALLLLKQREAAETRNAAKMQRISDLSKFLYGEFQSSDFAPSVKFQNDEELTDILNSLAVQTVESNWPADREEEMRDSALTTLQREMESRLEQQLKTEKEARLPQKTAPHLEPSPYEGKKGRHPSDCICSKHGGKAVAPPAAPTLEDATALSREQFKQVQTTVGIAVSKVADARQLSTESLKQVATGEKSLKEAAKEEKAKEKLQTEAWFTGHFGSPRRRAVLKMRSATALGEVSTSAVRPYIRCDLQQIEGEQRIKTETVEELIKAGYATLSVKGRRPTQKFLDELASNGPEGQWFRTHERRLAGLFELLMLEDFGAAKVKITAEPCEPPEMGIATTDMFQKLALERLGAATVTLSLTPKGEKALTTFPEYHPPKPAKKEVKKVKARGHIIRRGKRPATRHK